MHKKLFQKADGEMVTPEEQDAAKQTLTEMQINTSVVPFELNFPPPGFVVAYDSDVSESTLTEWLNANPWLVCVVVINKYALWKIGIGESKMEKMEMVSKDSYKELLFLAAKLNQMALMSSRKLEQWRVHISNATKGTPTVEPALDFAHFGPQSYFEPPDRR